MAAEYRFSFGPWNIHEGADPSGPTVRPSLAFAKKLKMYKELGFDGVQFHDDDAVPDMEQLSPADIERAAKQVRKMLEDEGLVAEFVAPRLWEDPRGVDGGSTSNDPACRAWALERLKRANDIGNALGMHLRVLWLARKGTYIREAKNAIRPTSICWMPSMPCSPTKQAGSDRDRAEAQRADGPGLRADDRPCHGVGAGPTTRTAWAG